MRLPALPQPIRCRSDLIGTVAFDGQGPSVYSGAFVPGPDFETYRPLFERAIELAIRVDVASPDDYLAAYSEWQVSLEAIRSLNLTLGDDRIPLEDFEVDDKWRVAFQPAVWWIAQGDRKNA